MRGSRAAVFGLLFLVLFSLLVYAFPSYTSPINITPASFAPTHQLNFSINWTAALNLTGVWFSVNRSGIVSVYIGSNASGPNTWNLTLTDFPAGTYYWQSNATENGTNGTETNTTPWYGFTISTIAPTLNLTLNGVSGPAGMVEDTYIWLNATKTTADSSGRMVLRSDSTVLYNATATYGNYTLFSTPGTYNISLTYEASQNYTASFISYLLQVNDTTPPASSGEWNENATFTPTGQVSFNVTWTDWNTSGIGVSISVNRSGAVTTYAASNSSATAWNLTLSAFPAGTHYWRTNATDVYGNLNDSGAWIAFTIPKATPVLNLTLNGTAGNMAFYFGTSIWLNGSLWTGDSGTSLSIYRSADNNFSSMALIGTGTSVANLTAFPTTGLFNITLNYTLSQNYSAGMVSYLVNVTNDTCGDLTASKTLISDITTTGTCFTINASNIVLDGNGFTITGDGDGNKFGIYSSGYDNITIRNFGGIANFHTAIYLLNVTNATITNNTNLSSWGEGIGLAYSEDIILSANTITTGSNENTGVSLFWTDRTIIASNTIIIIGDWYYTSAIVLNFSDYNNITNNILRGGSSAGIWLRIGNDGNLIKGNLINATSSPELIVLGDSNTVVGALLMGRVNLTSGSLTNVTIDVNTTPAADPEGKRNLSIYPVFEFSSGGYGDFNISYTDSDVTDFAESSIRLYRSFSSGWAQVSGATLDTASNTLVTGNLTTSGTYGLFGDAYPAYGDALNVTPATFDTTALLNFSINWTSNVSVTSVVMLVNRSGAVTPYAASNMSDNTLWNLTLSDFPAGTHYWMSNATDEENKTDITPWYGFTISTIAPTLSLTLNGVSGPAGMAEDTYIWLNATKTAADWNIVLRSDSTILYNATATFGNYTLFSTPGTYNISLTSEASQNYTSFFVSYLLTVNDTTPPASSGEWYQNATFTPTGQVSFNVTWDDWNTSGIGVFISVNRSGVVTTYAASNSSATAWNLTLSAFPAGTHYWRTNATDVYGNKNDSGSWIAITIPKAAPVLNLTLNGTAGNMAFYFGTSIWLNGSLWTGDPGTSLSIYRSADNEFTSVALIGTGTSVANLTAFPTTGLFNITLNYTLSQNYSAGMVSYLVNVTNDTCGDLTASKTLISDITTGGTCFTINASNIVLDGNGFTITGDGTGNGIASTGNYDNYTVKHFGGINNFSTGVYLDGSNNNLISIYNNSIMSQDAAIFFDRIIYTTISSNTLSTTGSSSNVINLMYSWGNVLDSNTITSAGNNSVGITINQSITTTVLNNIISVNGSGSSWGVWLFASAGSSFNDTQINSANSYEIVTESTGFPTSTTFANVVLGGMVNFTSHSIWDISIDVNTTPPTNPAGKRNLSDYLTLANVSGAGYIDFNLSFTEADLPAGFTRDTVRLYWYNESAGAWSLVNTSSFDTASLILRSGNISSPNGLYAPFGDFNGTEPTPTSHSPSGTVYTAPTTLTVTTAVNATCRYSGSTGIPYANMTSSLAGNATSHTLSLGTVVLGTYHYYVRCNNTVNIFSTSDYDASFVYTTAPPVSSGGGGGGLYVVPVLSEESAEPISGDELRDIIEAFNVNVEDGTAEIVVTNEDIPVMSIEFDIDSDVAYIDVVVTVHDSFPAEAGRPTPEGEGERDVSLYKYVEIDLNVSDEDSAGNVTVSFKVDKSWVAAYDSDPEEVLLQRYHNGGWQDLPTTLVDQSGSEYYYEASSGGFSVFAIVIKAQTPVEPVPTGAAVTQGEPGAVAPPGPRLSLSGVPVFIRDYLPLVMTFFVILLVSGLFGFYFVYLRKQLFVRAMEKKRVESIYLFPHFDCLPQSKYAYIGLVADTNVQTYLDHTQLNLHTLVAGGTGSGKTVAGMVIVEELVRHGDASIIVFDPVGQWTGFLEKNSSKEMLKHYPKFSLKGGKAFKAEVLDITKDTLDLDMMFYLKRKGLTVLKMDRLTPGQMDCFIEESLEKVYRARLPEQQSMAALIVLDEVHRLLPKYGGGRAHLKLEQAVREFRKWGIGLLMVSQVLTDFKGAIRGNIGTEIQLRTRYEGDIRRVRERHGPEVSRLVSKMPVGTAMVESVGYNKGMPYFVEFRPLLHSPVKLSEDELKKLSKAAKPALLVPEKLTSYVETCRAKGFGDEAIRQELLVKGWKKDLIEKAMSTLKKK